MQCKNKLSMATQSRDFRIYHSFAFDNKWFSISVLTSKKKNHISVLLLIWVFSQLLFSFIEKIELHFVFDHCYAKKTAKIPAEKIKRSIKVVLNFSGINFLSNTLIPNLQNTHKIEHQKVKQISPHICKTKANPIALFCNDSVCPYTKARKIHGFLSTNTNYSSYRQWIRIANWRRKLELRQWMTNSGLANKQAAGLRLKAIPQLDFIMTQNWDKLRPNYGE